MVVSAHGVCLLRPGLSEHNLISLQLPHTCWRGCSPFWGRLTSPLRLDRALLASLTLSLKKHALLFDFYIDCCTQTLQIGLLGTNERYWIALLAELILVIIKSPEGDADCSLLGIKSRHWFYCCLCGKPCEREPGKEAGPGLWRLVLSPAV